MSPKDRLINLCAAKLGELHLLSKDYKDRLKTELREIEVQNEYDYFLKLHDDKCKFPNEHNLLVPHLLGICDDFDVSREAAYTVGEYPDIDLDFIPEARDYIKGEWAFNTFGKEYVAQIGSYGTYRLNMALLDMARIFSKDRNEVLDITKQFDLKDDEGDPMTWDKALELYPNFREYVEKNPDVAEAAKQLTGRNRNAGQHASGIMISSIPVNDIVPLMGKDYQLVTAWTEGQASSDLSAVGLVKFDWLGLTTLQQISDCLKLIKERHGKEYVCNLPGQKSWSDLSYLNDPAVLADANRGDMQLTFQFGTEGIRRLARRGGVTSFEDIVAYASLYRPGPLGMKMDEVYCNRKNKKEVYSVHPLLGFLDSTYGVLCYQEQVMRMLNVVGDIPLRDCEAVRKAISKKKIEKFANYKAMFLENGQKKLGCSIEEVNSIWSQIEAFAGYGFNRSHAVAYSYLTMRQMWLKHYYPIEFYVSHFNNISGANPDEKIREAKRVAENHGVRVKKIDLGKSNFNFSIVDEVIYTGFSTIKGIGADVAHRISAGRPYKSFEDFLHRFGTDAKTIQPMLALGLFDEAHPITLFKFYEHVKKTHKKRADRDKRYQTSISKYETQLNAQIAAYGESDVEKLIARLEEQDKVLAKQIAHTYKSYIRSKNNYLDKLKYDPVISLKDFEPDNIDVPADTAQLLTNRELAEKQFYGFCWAHPLEKCIEAKKGFTFDKYKVEEILLGPVDGLIIKNVERVGKVKYRVLTLEDVNWEMGDITVWDNDYIRFQEELAPGNLVRLQLQAPTPPHRRYTLMSPPRHKRYLLPPKEQDFRVIKLIPQVAEVIAFPDLTPKDDTNDLSDITKLDMVVLS